MLTLFDDYPIHQTPEPVNRPASSDRDVYERYWFNGYTRNPTSGEDAVYIGVGTALYPHMDIQDCGISIVIDGVQHAFHASARATPEPTDLTVGPFNLEIVEPMTSCRVTLESNETDFKADLMFEGRSANIEEPRHQLGGPIRTSMDATRFTQLGRWSGWLEFDGRRVEFDPDEMLGTKDRSWGIRPVGGGDQRGAPGRGGGIFFLWAPIHFEDIGIHYQLFEDRHGRPHYSVGAFVPMYGSKAEIPGVEDPGVRHMKHVEHALEFNADNRMMTRATLAFSEISSGERHEMELEKLFTYRMKGIGYMHPEWGHGMWKGELAMAAERWALADVDESAADNQHVQHLVRVRMGDRVGMGALEQLIFGPYEPYGLTGAF